MNSLAELVDQIHQSDLPGFLETRETPCFESILFSVVFPEFAISTAPPLALYQHHFALFHQLYGLQEDYRQKGKYLHIHFMRTFLADEPRPGHCRYYDPYKGLFCGLACRPGNNYCPSHRAKVGEDSLELVSERYFYLEPSNFDLFDAKTAEAFLQGTWEIMRQADNVTASLDVLGLPPSVTIPDLKRRFRYLAKQCHPDHTGEPPDRFSEINNAYHFLMQILPHFNTGP